MQRRVAGARLPQRRDGGTSARHRRLEAVRPRPRASPRAGARGPQVRREAQRQQESRHSGGQERHRRHTDEPDICEYFVITSFIFYYLVGSTQYWKIITIYDKGVGNYENAGRWEVNALKVPI